MKKLSVLLLSFISLTFAMNSFAVTPTSPIPMLKKVSNQMLADLKANQNKLKNDPQVIPNIINKNLLPIVDVTGMSRSVIGRPGWMKATPVQRKEFTSEFKTLVIRTYGSALTAYSNQKIEFYPIRGGVAGRTQLQVQSRITETSGPAIPVSYRLIWESNTWKVYDFSVDGISMLQSFRSQFSPILAQGGLAEVIKTLKAHNEKTANE